MKKLISVLRLKTIRAKILGSFLIVILITASFSTYTYFNSHSSEQKTKEILHTDVELLVANKELAKSINIMVAAARGYVISGDIAYKEIYEQAKKDDAKNLELLKELAGPSPERRKVADTAINWQKNVEALVFAEYDRGNIEKARKNLQLFDDLTLEVQESYEQFSDKREENLKKLGKQTIDNMTTARTYGLVFALLVAFVSVTIAILTARSISNPIRKVVAHVQQMAEGDLSQSSIEVSTRDEVATLVQAINEMQNKLHVVLGSIQQVSQEVTSRSSDFARSSEEVKLGAEQIALTMLELSEGTEAQARSATDLTVVMERFSENVHTATMEDEELEAQSQDVHDLTAVGQGLMHASTEQMKTIDQIVLEAVHKVENLGNQSQRITKLVSVIREIADQTNLLALNAAIEAARAGETGKGFAVVAAEVKKLAEQVTYSVTDISKIVDTIQDETSNVTSSLQLGYEEVKKGTSQIVDTSATFDKIAGAVDSMFQNIQSISVNLHGIASTTTKIDTAIDEIAAVSEQSAAGVEETTATIEQTVQTMETISEGSEQLADLAKQLNQEIAHFKL